MTAIQYPKTYGTVVKRRQGRFSDEILVRPDDNAKHDVWLLVRWRCGHGSRDSFQRGTRVKVYERGWDGHLKFRKVGS